MAVKLGIISDTHDYLDPMVFEIFGGVDAILHAGDIEGMEIIRGLEKIAPVTAVAGNRESDEVNEKLPWITAVDFEGVKIALTHQFLPLNFKTAIAQKDEWTRKLGLEKTKAMVYGHTHEPIKTTLGGVFYFNPGFAGPPSEEPFRTVGIMTIDGGKIDGEIYWLAAPRRQVWADKVKFWDK